MSKTREGENIKISIKMTCTVARNSPTILQIYNIIMRRYVLYNVYIFSKKFFLFY